MPRKPNSQNPLALADDSELITLPSGETLSAMQTKAVILKAIGDMADQRIADEAGYSSRAALQNFLRSRRGQAGVGEAVRQRLGSLAAIGLQAKLDILKTSKDQHLRNQIATELMALGGIVPRQQQGDGAPGAGDRQVSISINLAQPTEGHAELDYIEHDSSET